MMQRINRFVMIATALFMFGALDVWAQPEGGQGERGAGGRGGAMMAMRSIPIEQILGFLAFDEKVGLSHEQLGKVRDALKAVYVERSALVKKLGDNNDRETTMTEVRKLRGQMTQKLTAVLDANQVEALKGYMQEMNQRGGRGGQGGPGGRGSGGRRDGGNDRE
jgi:hypothetical protein